MKDEKEISARFKSLKAQAHSLVNKPGFPNSDRHKVLLGKIRMLEWVLGINENIKS